MNESVEVQQVKKYKGVFPGYFVSIDGKASTVHAQCCLVVVIVVLTDITTDVYNYRFVKRI